MFNQKFYYMWQKYFIVIILFCLYACKGERKEQNTYSTIIEKKWAKDCSNDSKIHVLLYFPEKGCHLGTNRSDNET